MPTPSRHERAAEIFLEVCDLEEPARREALDRLCNGDAALRTEVEQLLEFDDGEHGQVRTKVAVPLIDEAFARQTSHSIPQQFGEYSILGVLGEGGMGVVYRARQSQPDRLVALKVIRSGLMTRRLQQRFEYEVDVLGRLQHTGIAQIYGAGREQTPTGLQPYFAMELVEGAPITDHANRHALATEDRIKLLIELCAAVQHAHEQGVIHRDLKPANVLVDARGHPKVLDFGVSRAIDRDQGPASMHTQTGVLVGTLAYMSVEQLEGDSQQVDTRSDVYALGVILFELLTGELPYPIAGKPFHVAIRTILDSEPRRVGTFNAATRGDLEVIVDRALAKHKSERYASVSEFSADLQRYLRSEPIEARRTHAWYVVRKSLYRHRIAASVAAAFVTLLIVALAVTLELYRVAEVALGEMVIAKDAAAQARDLERLQRYAAEMKLGYDAFDTADLERVRRMLDNQRPRAGEPDPRGFEWYWLDAISRGNRRSRPAHLSTVRAITVTPDGDRIITAGWDGSIRVWDGTSLELVATLDAHRRSVNALAVSASGRVLASAGWDKTVRVWDLRTMRPLHALECGEEIPMALALSPDGSRLAVGSCALRVGWTPTMTSLSRRRTGSPKGHVREHLVATGAESWTSPELDAGCTAVSYSAADSAVLAAGLLDGGVRVFDRTQGTDSVIQTRASIVWDLAIEPSRGWLMVAGGGWDEQSAIEIRDLRDGALVTRLLGHRGGATGLSIRRDGTAAFSSGWDRTVIEWDLETQSQRRRYRGSGDRLWAVAVRESDNELLAGGFDGMLHGWSLDAPDVALRMQHSREEKYNAVRFAPAGSVGTVATIAERGFVDVLDQDLQRSVRLKGHYRVVRALAFHPDGKRLISAGHGGEVRLWDITTGTMLAEWDGHKSRVWDLCFSPDGATAYSVAGLWHGRGELIAWDTASGKQNHRIDGRPATERRKGDVMRSVAATPDGRAFAFARNVNYLGGVIELRDTNTFERLGTFEGHDREVNSVRFHPQQPLMASGDSGGTLRVWNSETFECVAALRAHHAEITAVAFSHDGRSLASGSIDGTVLLWEPSGGHQVGGLHAGEGNLWSLDFSADDRTLAAAMDRSLTFWRVAAAPPNGASRPPKLFSVSHPSASGAVSAAEVQWQLSWSIVQQSGLDPRWYELALANAQAWLDESEVGSKWSRAIEAATERLHTAELPLRRSGVDQR